MRRYTPVQTRRPVNHPFNNDYPAWMLKPENTTPNDNYPSLLSKVTSIALNDDEVLHIETEMLREHIGLPRKPGGEQPVLPKMQPLFFIEKTPYSAQNGVLCKLRTCRKHVIRPGEYCVALDPPMGIRSNTQDSPERADFYHVSCFEKVADLSQAPFAKLVAPVTRYTCKLRGIDDLREFDGNYLVDAGAERLVLEWKTRQVRLINARDGVSDESESPPPEFAEVYYNAGRPDFRYGKKLPSGMTRHDFNNLETVLAPNESDGPYDDKNWNLFDSFHSIRGPESLNHRQSLSEMLKIWHSQRIIANFNGERVSNKKFDRIVQEARDTLGPKALAAIRRLSQVPMPNFEVAETKL